MEVDSTAATAGEPVTGASCPAALPIAPSASVSSSSHSSGGPLVPYLRVKPGNFSRLLYTNPVCLLTSAARPARVAADASAEAAAPTNEREHATESPAAGSPLDAAAAVTHSADSAPAAVLGPASTSSAASAAAPAPGLVVGPSRNVMTISWLTATSNHGELMMSMNAGRYSTTFVHAVGDRFVLNVPVRGMEELVKQIGGCSGRDDADTDKFTRLAIPTCRPGNKPIEATAAVRLPNGGGKWQHKPRTQALLAEDEADAEDSDWNLLAIPSCVAHLVCEVTAVHLASAPTPLVRAHNVLFSSVRRAYVHKDYWQNGNNFIAVRPDLPPYLTFLGSGNFAYVTR